MNFSEKKWSAVVTRGRHQHLMAIEPQQRRRDVWAECMRVYALAFREDINDPNQLEAHKRLSADWRSGVVRPVKVTISWEGTR